MSTTLDDTAQLLSQISEGHITPGQVPDDVLDKHIQASDVSNHKTYLVGASVADAVKYVSQTIVEKIMNNPDLTAAPLRRKTRFLLILNNIAMKKSTRNTIMEALGCMESAFETAMKEEGTLPFDSELGRMSEHILVLLMRVTNYKLKAVQVHEFAENHTQFAVQLLLAILLKEPPYEFELRCNCITGLLGFTNPQAFFQPDVDITFNECSAFSEKIDFIAHLLLRLQAVQVVSDVLYAQIVQQPVISSITHIGVTHMMRAIMNIFQLVSADGTQFRQHVLLSTTFADSTAVKYLELQSSTMQSVLSSTGGRPSFPPETIPGITLALKFLCFATFHMGHHGRCLRPVCTFLPTLLSLPLGGCFASTPQETDSLAKLYTCLFHFLSNIDAFSGDGGLEDLIDELPQSLQSKAITDGARGLMAGIKVAAGGSMLNTWHRRFTTVDHDALVSQDTSTFQEIDALFKEVIGTNGPGPVSGNSSGGALLGDLPSLSKDKKAPMDYRAAPDTAAKAAFKSKTPIASAPVEVPQTFVAPNKVSAQAQTSTFACALNGNMMKVPMRSPYGHVFEKTTIENWISQKGPVCPITGQALTLEQLHLDKPLQNEIMKAVVLQTMQTVTAQEQETDLYDF